MICDWCQSEAIREDVASHRCTACGGAHWLCPTQGCGRVVAECKGFCSACGAERCYPKLNGQKKPTVTACCTSGVQMRANAATSTGFDARKAEGYSHEGRIIVAGPRYVFIAPNPVEKTSGKNPALGLICEADAEDVLFSLPTLLPRNILLLASQSRLMAVSIHSGEIQRIGSDGSSIQPVAAPISTSAFHEVEVWTVRSDSGQSELIRRVYEPGECLEIGAFGDPSKTQGIAGIRMGTTASDGDRDGARGVWFLTVAENQSAEGYALDAGALVECGRHYDVCALPRTPPQRAMLWWSGSGELSSNGEWFWISRGGWDDDGALPVQKMVRVQSKEIEFKAFNESLANRAQCVSLSKTRETMMAQRSIDGAWVRTGENVRWGWCGEESVRLASDPGPIGWSDEALLNDVGVKPIAEQLGPLIPTRWGFAAVVAERGAAGRPDTIAILYFDFPKMIS